MGRLTRGSRREAEPRNISSPENLVETEGGPKPLLMAERFPAEVRAGLAAIGHEVVALGPWEQVMGHAQAILLREDGVLAGSADPPGDGFTAAW